MLLFIFVIWYWHIAFIIKEIMNKEIYLLQLQNELKRNRYNKSYINLCVSYAARLINSNLPVIFDMEHFCLLIGIEKSDLSRFIYADNLCYTPTRISKKSGGYRELDIPSADLKYIQRWILDNILSQMHVSKYATGFCNNLSIFDNAKKHINKSCVINMDIKDFFPSITFEQVFMIFKYYGYTKEVSFLLAKLCTYTNRLPQGSPASPRLSNIRCLKLDARLSALAKSFDAEYSRYADDITFSGSQDIVNLISLSKKIVKDEGFNINDKKTRIALPHQRQEVTGLIVNNGRIRVSKQYKRKLYQELYYCNKFGVADHMQKIKCDKAFYKEHLYGKAYFINLVEPVEGKKLFEILERIQWDY